MYITFIAFAVAGIITSILVKATEKHDFENADTNHFEIKLPKGFLILSIIVFCAELTLSVIALFADISQPILSATFLGCGYLLCAFLIIAYKRYRIFIDGETITYTPVIG